MTGPATADSRVVEPPAAGPSTAELEDLRATVRTLLSRRAARPPERRPGELDIPLWTRMASELGLAAMAVPVEHGGLGASWVELAIVLEETGRALLPLPYLSTVVAAAYCPTDELAGIAAGTTVATLATAAGLAARPDGAGYRLDGALEAVPDADVADLAVVAAMGECGESLYAVRLDGVDRTAVSTLDQTRPAARMVLDGAPARAVPGSPDRARDALLLAGAVESIGAAAANLELTLGHLAARRQFGTALAGFQALRHRVADLYTGLEAARSSVWYAIRADGVERELAAPVAALVAAEAAYAIAAEGIQLHGGHRRATRRRRAGGAEAADRGPGRAGRDWLGDCARGSVRGQLAAAVHHQGGSADIAGQWRGEHEAGVGDVVRGRHPS
jgi:alkylation response protein AidB-like acyl-CoA dehydrogenase